MNKISILLSLFFLSFGSFAQQKEIKKIHFSFSMFKSDDTEYTIDYKKNELSIVRFDQMDKKAFSKDYQFSNENFEKLKTVLKVNAPDSDIYKETMAEDGGGFTLNYYFAGGKSTRITIINPYRKDPKYDSEFKLINAFFDFAYSIVKDEAGIYALDNTYRPYFDGIPIRKVSDKPIEYKLWGSVTGDARSNKEFFALLDSFPKKECVIIDTNGELSWALENYILAQYITRDSNIKFANTDYLKHSRKAILEIRPKIQAAKNNNENMDQFKRSFQSSTYLADPEGMDKWLELANWNKTLEEIRKDCR